MIHRLPGWVWAGGFVLAAVAGMINVVGLMGVNHHGVTHLTGMVTLTGVEATRGDGAQVWRLVSLVASFVGGAIFSGALIGDTTLRLGRRYGVAMCVETGLLAAAAALLSRGGGGGVHLLCVAAGLQNALATTFSGAIVRTTHMTGVFTDIGIGLGQALRTGEWELRKLSLLASLAGGFVSGAAAGAWLYPVIGYGTLWVPTGITAIMGCGYVVARRLNGWLGRA